MKIIATSQLPYAVQRSIRKYEPSLRAAITRAVQQQQDSHPDKPLSAEEIGLCASEVVFGTGEYDKGMERICIDAYDRGHSTPLHEVINGLRSRVARPATISDC